MGDHVVHLHDVWMIELRERARLCDQALVRAIVLLPWVQDLERDLAVQFGVVGGVDHAHAAIAGLTEEDVAAELRGGGTAEDRLLGTRARLLHVETVDAWTDAAQLARWFIHQLVSKIRHRPAGQNSANRRPRSRLERGPRGSVLRRSFAM